MAKENSSDKPESRRSPVKLAEEAVNAKADNEKLPPMIGLPNSDDIVDQIVTHNMLDSLRKVKQNSLDEQVARSEAAKMEAVEKLDQKKKLPPTPATQLSNLADPARAGAQIPPQFTPLGGGGLMSSILAPNDRAAVLDTILKNLESDEAKVKWLTDHADLLGGSPSALLPHTPVSQAPPVQTGSTMLEAVSALESLVRMRDSISPPQQPAPAAPMMDVFKMAEIFQANQDAILKLASDQKATFSEILAKNDAQMQAIINAQRDTQEKYNEKLLAMQQASAEKDREGLLTQIQLLRDRANQPQGFQMGQLKEILAAARSDGVQLTTETPEQKRVDHLNEMEERKFEHQSAVELKKLELLEKQESRRAGVLMTAASAVHGMLESKAIKEHVPSEAAVEASGKW
jgi:hypothetical protein